MRILANSLALFAVLSISNVYAAVITGGVNNDCYVRNDTGPTYFCADESNPSSFASANIETGELKLNQKLYTSSGISIFELFQFELDDGFDFGYVTFNMLVSGQALGGSKATAEITGSRGAKSADPINAISNGGRSLVFGSRVEDGESAYVSFRSDTSIDNFLLTYELRFSRRHSEIFQYGVDFSLVCAVSIGEGCLLGNSAYFDIELGQGVNWTNRDNQFLSNPLFDSKLNPTTPNPINEPNGLILISLGLFGLLFRRVVFGK